MAKQRYINTKFWDDSYIVGLDPTEKLLFLYLLTSPLTNICGIYEVSLRRISFDTGIEMGVISTILKRFEDYDKALYYDGWIAMKNFIRHQTTNPKIVAGIRYEIAKAPMKLVTYVNFDFKQPKIKPKRKKISKKLREEILERDGHKCVKCSTHGSPHNGLEIDHIIPVIMGGLSTKENLQTLCQKCNGVKNAELRWKKDGSVIHTPPKKKGGQSHSNSNSNPNSNSNTNSNSNKTISGKKATKKKKNKIGLLVDYYFELKGWDDMPKSFYKEKKISYGRNCKAAKNILTLCDDSLEKAKKKVEKVGKWAEENSLDWVLETVPKRFLEI